MACFEGLLCAIAALRGDDVRVGIDDIHDRAHSVRWRESLRVRPKLGGAGRERDRMS